MPGVGTTHHVKLGGHYYLVKPGSYQKRVAPQFGARFTTGDPDFNNLSIWQHWSQRCFVGGMDAPEFADDAMYDEGVGIDTSEHEKVTVARDLHQGSGDWSMTAGDTRRFGVYNEKLYVIERTVAGVSGKLWRYDRSSDQWVEITIPAISPRCMAAFDGKLFIGGWDGPGTDPKIIYSNGNLSSWNVLTLPASGVSGTSVGAMKMFQQKLYVAFGSKVWRLKDDLDWDGNTVFYKANSTSESNFITNFETHLGFLYMLSENAHIHRTDGNTTFDIWNWDGQTRGVDIKSFDGRLFVATFEFREETDDEGFGVLYQMSGSAMTQLKRWGKEGEATTLGSLIAYDRKLFYGASNLLGQRAGFGIAMYDPIEDAHSIIATNGDGVTYAPGSAPYLNYMVDDVFAYDGQLWCSVRGHGIFKTPYQYRDYNRGVRRYDTTFAGGSAASENGGYLVTSTYDAGTPGLRKLWRKVVIDYYLPHADTQLVIEYTPEAGLDPTWTEIATIDSTTGVVGERSNYEIHLENVTSVSFKMKITLRTTNSIYSPVLLGFVVSYIPLVEANWMWTFSIVLSEKQELLDGTDATVDTEAEFAFLDTLYRTKALVHFVDVDGSLWASGGEAGVLVYDMTQWKPMLSQPLEGEVQLTLLEAVETY